MYHGAHVMHAAPGTLDVDIFGVNSQYNMTSANMTVITAPYASNSVTRCHCVSSVACVQQFIWCAVVCCSHQFYKGKLKDGVTAEQKPAAAGINWPQPQQPVMVLAVQGREEQAKKSRGKVKHGVWRLLCCSHCLGAAACSRRYIGDVYCSLTGCTPKCFHLSAHS